MPCLLGYYSIDRQTRSNAQEMSVRKSDYLTSLKTITSDQQFKMMKPSEQALTIARFQLELGLEGSAIKTLVHLLTSHLPEPVDINPAIVDYIVWFLLPPMEEDERFTLSHYEQRILRLGLFLRMVLRLPRCEAGLTSKVSSGMKEAFTSVVNYVRLCIDQLRPRTENEPLWSDMHDDSPLYEALDNPGKVNLGLGFLPALYKVIGPSKSPKRLYTHHLTQALRMISILNEVNQNWGLLLGCLTAQQIVPSSTFEVFNYTGIDDFGRFMWDSQVLSCYPFLVSSEFRKTLYLKVSKYKVYGKRDWDPEDFIEFKVSRETPVRDIVSILAEKKRDSRPYWDFTFASECGVGTGPTKEFYAKFSQDVQRYDLNLWIGDPQLSKDGTRYVTSPCGLFPSPCLHLDDYSRDVLTTFGKLLAKSQIDDVMMDLNLSSALCKFLLKGRSHEQRLNLSDLKDVMPSLVEFVEELVKMMNDAARIKRDRTLTYERKVDELINLKYHGCRLDDLCINFTVPGFPDIEMIDGGAEIFLTVENIEEYLQLLVWWLLYKGPQKKLECIQAGYDSILSRESMKPLLIGDMKEIFSGMASGPWTVEELRKGCYLKEDLTVETPVVKHLFEVLASFTREEQRNFLRFVTSSTNLPVGGFSNLDPPLTIDRLRKDGHSDAFLPSAMTCVNLLFLPEYSSPEVLRDKFLVAFQEGDSFQFR